MSIVMTSLTRKISPEEHVGRAQKSFQKLNRAPMANQRGIYKERSEVVYAFLGRKRAAHVFRQDRHTRCKELRASTTM